MAEEPKRGTMIILQRASDGEPFLELRDDSGSTILCLEEALGFILFAAASYRHADREIAEESARVNNSSAGARAAAHTQNLVEPAPAREAEDDEQH